MRWPAASAARFSATLRVALLARLGTRSAEPKAVGRSEARACSGLQGSDTGVIADRALSSRHRWRPNGRIGNVTLSNSSTPETATDLVIARYKEGIDRTLIRDNLRRSHEERLLALQQMQEFVAEVRAAGEAMRRGQR